MRGFASDNQSGVHPDILTALASVNIEHTPSYGADPWTADATKLMCSTFGATDAFFVFNGTGANVVALKSVLRSHQAVICATTAHLNIDECAAPEITGQFKLLGVPSRNGKLTVQDVIDRLVRRGDEHHVQPRVVSITQPTELGTVYSCEEMRAIADVCHANNLLLHVDGSRLVNAAAFLGVSLKQITADVGVDILSLGGTKNALMFGEAILFFGKGLAEHARYVRKQCTQLYAKSRFVAAQFTAFLSHELWLKNARHANAMAKRLAESVSVVPGVTLTQVTQANAVFAIIPKSAAKLVKQKYFFYEWDELTGEVRWMTSFDTQQADVDGLVAELKAALTSM